MSLRKFSVWLRIMPPELRLFGADGGRLPYGQAMVTGISIVDKLSLPKDAWWYMRSSY